MQPGPTNGRCAALGWVYRTAARRPWGPSGQGSLARLWPVPAASRPDQSLVSGLLACFWPCPKGRPRPAARASSLRASRCAAADAPRKPLDRPEASRTVYRPLRALLGWPVVCIRPSATQISRRPRRTEQSHKVLACFGPTQQSWVPRAAARGSSLF